MKKRIMLQKANKILAAVMIASMLTSTIVPGTAVYASEFTAEEVEQEEISLDNGFSDKTDSTDVTFSDGSENAVAGMENVENDDQIALLQQRINALPTVDEFKAMIDDTVLGDSTWSQAQMDIYMEAEEIAEIYEGLMEEEQQQIDTAKMEALFEYFNNMVSEMADYKIGETDRFVLNSNKSVTATFSVTDNGFDMRAWLLCLVKSKPEVDQNNKLINSDGTRPYSYSNCKYYFAAESNTQTGTISVTWDANCIDQKENGIKKLKDVIGDEDWYIVIGPRYWADWGIGGSTWGAGKDKIYENCDYLVGAVSEIMPNALHSHSWELKNYGNIIEARCKEAAGSQYCEYNTWDTALEVKLEASDMPYSENGYSGASVSDDISTIVYGKKALTSEDIKYYKEGESNPLKEVPKDVGTYIAKVIINGMSAEKMFKITPVAATATVEPKNELTYNGSEQELIQVENVAGVTGHYKLGENGEWSTEIPKATNAGKYTVFYYMEATNPNYKAGGSVDNPLSYSVEIAKKNFENDEVRATGYTGVYDKEPHTIKIELSGAAKGAEITYSKIKDGNDGFDTENPEFVNVTDADGAIVWYRVKGNANYADKIGSARIIISKKPITVSVTAQDKIYDKTTNATVTASVGETEGLFSGDSIIINGLKGTFENANAGENKTVTVSKSESDFSITGVNNENYEVTIPEKTFAAIKQKELTEDMVLVNTKGKNEFEVVVKDGDKLEEQKDYRYVVEPSEKDEINTITITGTGNYTGNIVKKITAIEKPTKGNIVTAVTLDENVKSMKPALRPVSQEEAKELLAKNLTDENAKKIVDGTDKGSYNATIYLEMKAWTEENITSEAQEDIEKIKELIKDGKKIPSSAQIGKNLDLKLMMSCVVKDNSGNWVYSGNNQVLDTDKCEQTITLTIPEDLKTTAAYTTRTYYVICVHNGEAEVISSTLSGDKLTFNATKFSTYTIAYKDTYYAPSYPVTGIKVSTDKVNLTKKGETAQVKVEVTPSYADNKNLTWKSSDEKVATVDKDGKITAVGNGTATITVTSVSGNYTATITVTVNDESEVKPAEIEKITIDTEAKTLTKIGESVELKVKVEPENADSSKLIWKSDNEKVAVVDKDGKVTAVGNGTATITVSTEDGKHTATVTITVKVADEPAVNKTTSYGNLKARSVKQTNNSVTLEWTRVSGADGYLIYGNRCNGNGKTYKYQKIATITNGKTRTWTQKGLTKGTYYKYIVKAYKLVNGKKVVTDTSVSVHAVTKGGKYGVAKAVSVTKIGNKKNTLKVTLKNGKTAQITAKKVKMDKPIRHHRNLCYESSNTKVATVTPDGLIQATGKGTCSIWVYAQNGVYKTITVTVK